MGTCMAKQKSYQDYNKQTQQYNISGKIQDKKLENIPNQYKIQSNKQENILNGQKTSIGSNKSSDIQQQQNLDDSILYYGSSKNCVKIYMKWEQPQNGDEKMQKVCEVKQIQIKNNKNNKKVNKETTNQFKTEKQQQHFKQNQNNQNSKECIFLRLGRQSHIKQSKDLQQKSVKKNIKNLQDKKNEDNTQSEEQTTMCIKQLI
ncbi:hypothetical protein PPERSA_12429 [Pseudocohnilembus persalinus]|uniref:Uncharacterized protein n=1 Tax=Pseudocohnilembus persalinus TaxID=266149 RepID=A0A0V0QNX7_PSEPJ|nr:hypothetical protein PPERSA_12429 [Pseudocohnilembus persalinus]|eukprot:KRX03982.1 hypothetical protein PPERSA_12429 [Pseudocohnilembus persalinus]